MSKRTKKPLTTNVPGGDIVIYRAAGGEPGLEVRLEQDTVWLTQKQIAGLFLADRSVINKHLRNIFTAKELEEKRNVQKMHIPFSDKLVSLYNLDVVISIGYRVNSRRATQFRVWATKVLKDHLVKGYSLNQKRLTEETAKFKELQATVNFIKGKSKHPQLTGKTDTLLDILSDYANALTLLYQYDRKTVPLSKKRKPVYIITYAEAKKLIAEIKSNLARKKETGDFFGEESGAKFEAIIGSLYQTFAGKDLYSSLEEKAAHLLYFTIKDHPFHDGNKRIASLLFLYFLEKNDYLLRDNREKKINDNAIIALSLLIATSDPREKDIMVKIITNLLK